MFEYIYTGPSWASLSYDSRYGEFNPLTNLYNSTNLAVEWNISFADLTKQGASNIDCYNMISKFNNSRLPIIWVMCEPLVGLSKQQQLEFLKEKDYKSYRKKLLRQQLELINTLNVPIGLIGGHTDILYEDIFELKNIEIIESSWQTFLAKLTPNVQPLEYHWGVEVAHRIQDKHRWTVQKPTKQLILDISEGFEFWRQLELSQLFYDVHPNFKATQLYASYLKKRVEEFLNEHKN